MLGSETETSALLDGFVGRRRGPRLLASRAHALRLAEELSAERGPGDQEDEDGRPYMKSQFFREPLPAGAVETLLKLVRGRRPGEARKLDFMPWGGAYNRARRRHRVPHREELFLLEHSVVVPAGFDAPATEAARAWLSDSWELCTPPAQRGGADFPIGATRRSTAPTGATTSSAQREGELRPGGTLRLRRCLPAGGPAPLCVL